MALVRTLLLALGLTAPLAATVAAEATGPGVPISPAEVVQAALERNPMIAASEHGVAAAEADQAYAETGYLPRIDLVESFARSTNPVFVFASKLGQERFTMADFDIGALNTPDAINNFATRVQVRQNIWDGHRAILGRRAATLGAEAARAQHQRTTDAIAFEALQAYRDLGVAEEMVGVTRDAEAAADANLTLARELEEAGLTVPSDRMSAEVRQAEVRSMRIRAEQGVTVARAALARAMGVETPEPYTVRFPELRPEGPEQPADWWIGQALERRTDLEAMRRRVDQAELGERLARSKRRPEIGAMAGYEWNGDRLLGTDGDNWTVGVGLTVPVFDGNETRSRVARARAERGRAEAMLRAMEQGIALEVRAAWTDADAAARQLAVAASVLERAEEALRIVRDRYGEGMAVMVELLGAEAAHTEARAMHAAARGDLFLARTHLRLAGGAPDLTGIDGPDAPTADAAGREVE